MAKVAVKQLVGMRVRDLRKQLGLSQMQLADRVGLSLNMIGYVERGIKFVSPESIEKFSKALKVTPDELFRSDPRDVAPDAKRAAMQSLEALLSRDSAEYIQMVAKMLRAMKRR